MIIPAALCATARAGPSTAQAILSAVEDGEAAVGATRARSGRALRPPAPACSRRCIIIRLGLTLSHYDARGHLVVARRIIDNITPGWQQIGAVWLPLPHLLNALPVQIDLFYRTGASAVALSILSFAVRHGRDRVDRAAAHRISVSRPRRRRDGLRG